MQNTRKINGDVTVGPQPSEQDVQQIVDQQFRTVINFRTAGEPEQPLSPEKEGEMLKAAGVEYRNFPISMESMGPELVDQFRAEYPRLPKPLFAHCKSGKRAGAMVMMHLAVEEGMTGEQTLQQAKEMGFECDQPELKKFVKNYVDKHSQ